MRYFSRVAMNEREMLLRESARIWEHLKTTFPANSLASQIEISKSAMDTFHIFPYYYFIADLKKPCFELVSPQIKDVLGYDPDEVNIPFIMDKIHPRDKPHILNFEEKAVEFLSINTEDRLTNYKISYDYRLKKKDGNYLRILQQSFAIAYDKKENTFRSLSIHTDISRIKDGGVPKLSMLGLNGYPSFLNVDVKEKFNTNFLSPISKRELEILLLLAAGKTTKEISTELFIAQETVNKHRKNMLQKTNTSNTALLISTAIKEGWI